MEHRRCVVTPAPAWQQPTVCTLRLPFPSQARHSDGVSVATFQRADTFQRIAVASFHGAGAPTLSNHWNRAELALSRPLVTLERPVLAYTAPARPYQDSGACLCSECLSSAVSGGESGLSSGCSRDRGYLPAVFH